MEKIVVVLVSLVALAGRFGRVPPGSILIQRVIVALLVSQHPTRRPPQPIEPSCLKCLCEVDSGCTNSNCTDDPDRFGGGPACGWYKMNKHYYRVCDLLRLAERGSPCRIRFRDAPSSDVSPKSRKTKRSSDAPPKRNAPSLASM